MAASLRVLALFQHAQMCFTFLTLRLLVVLVCLGKVRDGGLSARLAHLPSGRHQDVILLQGYLTPLPQAGRTVY